MVTGGRVKDKAHRSSSDGTSPGTEAAREGARIYKHLNGGLRDTLF